MFNIISSMNVIHTWNNCVDRLYTSYIDGRTFASFPCLFYYKMT